MSYTLEFDGALRTATATYSGCIRRDVLPTGSLFPFLLHVLNATATGATQDSFTPDAVRCGAASQRTASSVNVPLNFVSLLYACVYGFNRRARQTYQSVGEMLTMADVVDLRQAAGRV